MRLVAEERVKAPIVERMRTGIRYGFAFAAIYCAYVVIAYALTGGHVMDGLGVTLPTVLLVYVVGMSLAGAVVGLIFPLVRISPLGAIIVGVLGMAPPWVSIAVAMSGLPPWDQFTTLEVAALIVVFGTYGGLLLRSRVRKRDAERRVG